MRKMLSRVRRHLPVAEAVSSSSSSSSRAPSPALNALLRAHTRGTKRPHINLELESPSTDAAATGERATRSRRIDAVAPRAAVKEEAAEETRMQSAKAINVAVKMEKVVEEEEVVDVPQASSPSKATVSRSPLKKERSVSPVKPRAPPPGWEETLVAIRAMRRLETAPVDVVGCAMLASTTEGEKVYRFQTLVALMLSSQTKDPVTAQAVANLRRHGLTVPNLLATSPKVLDSLICKVGFHNRKTIYLLETAKVLHEQYDDDIPDTLEGLVALPGVGPKMAFLTLQVAWKKNHGIGVDVHVHRISNRLRWVHTESASDGPEATRKELESWLPQEYWEEINPLLVGFGQTVCTPLRPQCGRCTLNMTCPSSSVKRSLIATANARLRAVAKQDPDGATHIPNDP